MGAGSIRSAVHAYIYIDIYIIQVLTSSANYMAKLAEQEQIGARNGLLVENGRVTMVYYPVDKNIPIYRAFGWHGHVGVDWIEVPGTDVIVINDAEIIECAEDSRIYGRYILAKHNDGYGSLYAHLSKKFVKKGDKVIGGQVIGLSGGAVGSDGAGASEGYHLHFEIRPPGHLNHNWNNVDPIEYIKSKEEHNNGTNRDCIIEDNHTG